MANHFVMMFFLAALLLPAGCGEEDVPPPPPQELTGNDAGYFCSMTVIGHPGPKAQIHLTGNEKPLWFTSVRDMFGFLLLPGESREVAAIYVTDMTGNDDWEGAATGPWVDPKTAWFVIDSSKTGGMGAAETVPFSGKEEAQSFADKFGGRLVSFDGVPADYIFNTNSGLERDRAESATPGKD